MNESMSELQYICSLAPKYVCRFELSLELNKLCQFQSIKLCFSQTLVLEMVELMSKFYCLNKYYKEFPKQ